GCGHGVSLWRAAGGGATIARTPLPRGPDPMNRREFLATAAISGGLTSPGSPAKAQKKDKPVENPNKLPIVDTHQHLWDLSKFRLAWFDPDTPEGKILGHSFTAKEYAEATKGLNVVKAVY